MRAVSDNAVSSGVGDENYAIIRRAALLRSKYQKHRETVALPVSQVGAHPANRDGQGPSSSRCLELTSTILRFGFDSVEANSNGVLVEQKPGSDHIQAANKRFAEGDVFLAPVHDGQICYGTLSHSTLNQLMKNIHANCPGTETPGAASPAVAELGQAPCDGTDDVCRILDSNGRLSVSLFQQVDPGQAESKQAPMQMFCAESLHHMPSGRSHKL